MPENDNDSDKLEQFFQNAASRPDIVFNEGDWKKLEAQLDSLPPPLSVTGTVVPRIAAAVLISLVFIAGSFHWTQNKSVISFSSQELQIPDAEDQEIKAQAIADPRDNRKLSETNTQTIQSLASETTRLTRPSQSDNPVNKSAGRFSKSEKISSTSPVEVCDTDREYTAREDNITAPREEGSAIIKQQARVPTGSVTALGKNKIQAELLKLTTTSSTERFKQKAGSQLPGAEEADGLKNEASVEVAKASDEKTALASPRLSLLLSLAPDFSSTSMTRYTSPGGAYGAMIHYHIRNSWSISTGLVRSRKKYTGDGEDYQPPKGYWKYYTNGVIPESIDGSCNILEIPIMLQYTLAQSGRSRFLIGAGASSYVMLDESYAYNFDQPNPGAKERWDSKNSSRFYFNMINFTVGFERQIAPGLLIGIEPYLKIPIEEIGWSNLKLFSTGAAFTLRYRIINKNPSRVNPKSKS